MKKVIISICIMVSLMGVFCKCKCIRRSGNEEVIMNRGITQKQYLGLVPPTEEDARSSQMRILDALKEKGITASFTLPALQKLYPICDEADYNITVSLAWNGSIWQVVDLEAGDTAAEHYGYAADLGSTTVVVRLVKLQRRYCACRGERIQPPDCLWNRYSDENLCL